MKPLTGYLGKEIGKELYDKAIEESLKKLLGNKLLTNLEKIGSFGDAGINLALGYKFN